MRRVALIAAAIAILDQLTKVLVVRFIGENESRPVIQGVFSLVNWRNSGAAWGIFQGFNLILAVVSVLTILVLYLFRHSFQMQRPSSSIAAITAIAATASQSTKEGTRGVNAIPYCIFPALLSQPLDERGRMHQVGLIVSSQGVHHDVDPGAESEFALSRLTRRQWQHRLPVRSYRPGAGKIV